MEILDVLNEMEEFLDECTKIPMTGKLIIDEDDILDFVDRIRSVLPEEIKQARWIAKEHQRIISDAEAEAEKIVTEAKEQISKLAEENEVVKMANDQAEEIIKKAREAAGELKVGANSYADEILGNLEKSLENTIESVKSGRQELYEVANK